MRTLVLLLAFCLPTVVPADDAGSSLAAFPRTTLTIATSSARQHTFRVWLARSPEQQARGLMFVKELPADAGMLFIEDPPRVMAMWMKNTFISLDMLFIGADGRVLHIEERTTPHSLKVIGYERPVRAVLELRGGETRARGIRAGDLVQGWLFAPVGMAAQ